MYHDWKTRAKKRAYSCCGRLENGPTFWRQVHGEKLCSSTKCLSVSWCPLRKSLLRSVENWSNQAQHFWCPSKIIRCTGFVCAQECRIKTHQFAFNFHDYRIIESRYFSNIHWELYLLLGAKINTLMHILHLRLQICPLFHTWSLLGQLTYRNNIKGFRVLWLPLGVDQQRYWQDIGGGRKMRSFFKTPGFLPVKSLQADCIPWSKVIAHTKVASQQISHFPGAGNCFLHSSFWPLALVINPR